MANYIYKHTKIVDQCGPNYLVRGSIPIDQNNAFAYDQIHQDLREQIGASFNLRDFQFIDFSLIDSTGEKYMLQVELDAYELPESAITGFPPFNHGYEAKLQGERCLGNPGHFPWSPGYSPPWNASAEKE